MINIDNCSRHNIQVFQYFIVPFSEEVHQMQPVEITPSMFKILQLKLVASFVIILYFLIVVVFEGIKPPVL